MATNAFMEREPTTQRGRRIADNRSSKLEENVKTAMFIKGPSTNQVMSEVLTDFYDMKKPDAVWYARKEANRVLPFEDMTTLEFYSNRSDASLFMFGSNSKKRPNNLVIGRTFDYKLLDMIEFGVSNFQSMKDFNQECQAIGSKPMFVLSGEAFATEEVYKIAANLIVDFFRGHIVERINIQGLDHVIQLSAKDGIIHFAHYSVKLKKSGSQIPKVVLTEIGPTMDLTVRRSKLAAEDLRRESLKTPAALQAKKRKNITTTALKATVGRLHVPNQEIDKIVSYKPKGLKRTLEGDDTEITKPAKRVKKSDK